MPQMINRGCLTAVIAVTSQKTANPPQRTLNGTRKASAEVKRTLGSGCPAHNNCSPWRRRGRRRLRGSFMREVLHKITVKGGLLQPCPHRPATHPATYSASTPTPPTIDE